jgi:hypothetical protein
MFHFIMKHVRPTRGAELSLRLRSAADGIAGTNRFTVRVERWPAEVRSKISDGLALVSISARVGIRDLALSGPKPMPAVACR